MADPLKHRGSGPLTLARKHAPRLMMSVAGFAIVGALASGCTPSAAPAASTPPGPGAPSTSASTSSKATATGTPIRITVDGRVLHGRLNSTTAAQRLAARLPMTATFGNHPDGGDFPAKVTHLDPALSTAGTELGAAPGPGDIALYVPSGNLGLYYGQLEHWDGAVTLGAFTGDPATFGDRTTPFTVTITAE